MEKPTFDFNALPEPFKNVFQNIDMSTLEQLRNSLDPATLTALLSSSLGLLQNTLKPEDAQALNNLMGTVMQLLQNKQE